MMSLKGFLRGDQIWERMVAEENKKPVVTAKRMPTAQMSTVFKMIEVKYLSVAYNSGWHLIKEPSNPHLFLKDNNTD